MPAGNTKTLSNYLHRFSFLVTKSESQAPFLFFFHPWNEFWWEGNIDLCWSKHACNNPFAGSMT